MHKMLLHRSIILLKVLLLALAVTSAEYDYSSEYGYGDERPSSDYTIYFNQVGAASRVAPNKEKPENYGFIQPAEFESFFNAPLTHFGAEAKASTAPQTFLAQPKKLSPFEAFKQTAEEPRDYFEESQKKQETVKSGPHYVSHQLPAPESFKEDEERAQSKDDVETIPPPLSKKHKKIKPSTYDTYDDLDAIIKTEEQATKIDPLSYYGTKSANYDTGKSSSTVAQYPAAAGYLASLKIPTTTVTPYQKYSYQPLNYEALQSKYLEALVSTPSTLKNSERANLNDNGAANSDNVPENLKNKDCRKIQSPENAENMNCFVCEDAPNKSKYTQCSYKSSEEPVNEFAGSSIRYSSPVKAPSGFRYKRSPGKGKYSDDPYFQVSQRNRKYFEDYDKEQQVAESERQKDFHYKPYQPEEYESYSESQSSEILKQPGACQKVDREGMTCTVCKDPKTGGNFEQCSYTSAPKEHKYAYVAEKKYDSEEDQPEETKTVTKQSSVAPTPTSTERTFVSATKSKRAIPELKVAATNAEETSAESPETEEEEEVAESDEEEKEESNDDDGEAPTFNYQELKKDKKLVGDDPYDVPQHFAESVSDKKTAEEDDGEENFDEYHYKLFPELNSKEEAESRNEEQKTDATEQKQQDVEEVLAEFAKKDRSNCKKAEKNGMTCFLCVDNNKVQHEECMYVAESKPKPTHIAYHEVQRLKDPKDDKPEESKTVETVTQKPRKKFFKKVVPEVSAAASNVHQSVVPFDAKASASAPDAERLEDAEKKQAEPETPEEVDVGDEEGAYSHETKPTYSKLFGTTLPKYMVEKTEFEKDFDEVAGF